MSDKKYWTSFAALKNKEEIQKLTENEFSEDLPFEDLNDKGLFSSKHARRDFLKYVGFSTAAATIAASCKTPVRKAMPFVNRMENTIPGVAKYYASTYVQEGDAVPVVVKVRDGRPIKIEGNELYPFTQGGTSARVQASVLDLYDMYRLTNPKRKSGGSDFQEIPTWEQVDTQITTAIAANGPVVLLTSTINSPSTKQLIGEFLAKAPAGSRHVQFDAMSYSGLLQANGGKAPGYEFDKARVIVSLGADFLGTWLSPVEFARQYSLGRKIDEKNPVMSKHYQFESFLSMTGASADERYTHRPSETGAVAAALYTALSGGRPALSNPDLTAAVQKAAKDLVANSGNAVVVCGSNDVNVQAIVAAINSKIAGAVNGPAINTKQGNDADFIKLVEEMNAGTVGTLLIAGANPVYEYFDAEKFKSGLGRVKLSVSFNEKMDATTELCQYSLPGHHYLESWGDAEPRAGHVSFIQPTIAPLFKTRPFQTSLLKWSGNNTDYETYFVTYWTGKLGGQAALDKALQDGVLVKGTPSTPTPTLTQTLTPAQADTTDAIAAPTLTPTQDVYIQNVNVDVNAAMMAVNSQKSAAKNEVVLYQKVSLGTGKQAGNPWLLELPDPVTRATWDNYALISVAKAKELGIDYAGIDFEYYQNRPLIEITVNNKKVTLPVMVVPGMDPATIAIAVGFGQGEKFSKAAEFGQNVFPFARMVGTSIVYYNDAATSASTTGDYKVARIQMHDSYEGRTEVLRETTMGTFKSRPDEIKEWRKELHEDYSLVDKDKANERTYRQQGTLYTDPETRHHEIKWGMSIDLNSCIGCGACVVACHSENNVPVVGKNEVLRGHEMHWLRIDRYFVTDSNTPDKLDSVIFQPMLCQHCDNAPCENVCPVAATMHNTEGINQMAYNRCIGTRYCANNCPYKVRRFNWADYTGASTHGKLGPNSGVGKLNEAVHQMNDELTRMVLNPDVVTRSRGVMEKCTFCVQRTQEGKLKAKQENRRLGGDEVKSACAQACPTNAIVFGNAGDPTSKISQIRQNNTQRSFYVLEQLHTLSNITYLAKIRNTDEIIELKHGGEAAHAEEKKGEHSVAEPEHK